MKVVRIIARLNIGGPARHAAILQEGLHARGFDTLLVHGSLEAGEGSLEHLIASRALRVVRIPELGRRISLWSDGRALWQLVRLIFRERPDVVHTHTAKAGTLGRLAALAYNCCRRRATQCLVVHTFHGHVLTGYFGAAGSAAIRMAERLLALGTDRVVTISLSQRIDIARHLGIGNQDKLAVIPLGLELSALLALPRERDLHGGEVVFGYVGRLVPIKDLPTLLQAFASVLKELPAARLLIVGDGEAKPDLERMAGTLGIGSAVTFMGWCLDLEKVYASMDVVVLSSLNEGTPVALIEAMAAGLPVVATSVGGVPDLVTHERTGLLVTAGQPDALAQAMLAIAHRPEWRSRLGAAARDSVAERFRPDRLVDDVVAMYTGALAMKRQPHAPRAT